MRRCWFPFVPRNESACGMQMVHAALSEALCDDDRFTPRRDEACVEWFPVVSGDIGAALDGGRRVAIGPNVLYGNSQTPGAGALERQIHASANVDTVFCLSRWYAALIRRHMPSARIALIPYPVPAWLLTETEGSVRVMASNTARRAPFVYVKGGAAEESIAASIAGTMSARVIRYGQYRRWELLALAASSTACYYISREDNYPLAGIEVGLCGCPIISDERACPVVVDGLTGVIVPVRERGESEAFHWQPDAAARLIEAQRSAAQLDPAMVRSVTVRRHSATACRERVAEALRLG